MSACESDRGWASLSEKIRFGFAERRDGRLPIVKVSSFVSSRCSISIRTSSAPLEIAHQKRLSSGDPIALTFIFSAPGFELTMRCNSVLADETPTTITPEEQLACAHLGHSESANRQDEARE